MRRVLRQDPDVILIGEMRDEETVRTALSAAETGHLVLSTVHTLDATETINRIIDFFPPHLQQQARVMLSSTLKGAIAQRLVPDVTGEGRVAAAEVMVVTGRVQDLILNPEETGKITEVIAEGEYYGMRTFDQSLLAYVMEGQISEAGGDGLRLQPARLQTDAGRRRAAGQRYRAARSPGRWRDEGEAEQQSDRPDRLDRGTRRSSPDSCCWAGGGGSQELDGNNRQHRSNGGGRRHERDRHRHRGDPGEAVEGAVAGAVEAAGAEASGSTALPTSVPTPPLPAPLSAAYEGGKTVVLLVVQNGGIDDQLVVRAVKRLESAPRPRGLRRPGQADRPLRGDHPRRRTSSRSRRWS